MSRTLTPWQRVFAKFNLSQSDLARALQCDRSKISRALRDPDGLISGRDQKRIIAVAEELNVKLSASDFYPPRAA